MAKDYPLHDFNLLKCIEIWFMAWDRGREGLSVKGQMANILGFGGHVMPSLHILPCFV